MNLASFCTWPLYIYHPPSLRFSYRRNHGQHLDIHVSLFCLSLVFLQTLPSKQKKPWKPPTKSTSCSFSGPSSSPERPSPSSSTPSFRNLRPHLLPPLWIPIRRRNLLFFHRRRMPHQERRDLREPPPLNGQRIPGLQFHQHSFIAVRRTLAQPPPPLRSRNLLLQSPQHVSRNPQGRNPDSTPPTGPGFEG